MTGRLLIASPNLGDGNFARTVVLLLAHGAEGALGIVLNRPSPAEVREILPKWHDLATEPAHVFRGGPVAISAVIGLALPRPELSIDGVPGLDSTVAGLVSVDLSGDPDLLAHAVTGVRVFAGYAGWSAGQLEGELEIGGWILADPAPDDPITDDPDGLWARVLRRLGGLRAAYASAPPNLSLN